MNESLGKNLKRVFQYWLFSIIQTDAITWADRNQDGKTNNTFKIKRSSKHKYHHHHHHHHCCCCNCHVLHYTDYQQYTSNMLQCQCYITPAAQAPFMD